MLHAKYEGESLLPWYSRANLPEKFYFVIPNARTMYVAITEIQMEPHQRLAINFVLSFFLYLIF